jgi:hypothetical protein
MLPGALVQPLRLHLVEVHKVHQLDLADGFGRAALPKALARKYAAAPRERAWQWVFPQPASPDMPPATHSGTPSLPTSSRMGRTSGRSRSYWATPT